MLKDFGSFQRAFDNRFSSCLQCMIANREAVFRSLKQHGYGGEHVLYAERSLTRSDTSKPSMSSKTTTQYPVTWYCSTIWAAFMVAGTAFMLPGIFSALNGMGAGGGAKADTTNAANAIVFGVLAVFSLFVGVICQKITPKWTLLVS